MIANGSKDANLIGKSAFLGFQIFSRYDRMMMLKIKCENVQTILK